MDGGSKLTTTTPSPHVEFDIIIFPLLPEVPQTFIIIIKNPLPSPHPSQRKKQPKVPTNKPL